MNYKGITNNMDLATQRKYALLTELAEGLQDGEVVEISRKMATLKRWGTLIGVGFLPMAAMLGQNREG